MTVLPPIAKFPEVDQADASGELAKVYDDIELTLRAPWVPFAIRVMSLFPAYVPAAWQMLKPQISTVYAENGANLVPYAVEKLHLMDPDAAAPDVQELMRQAKDLLLHHAPMSDFRVLAAWPDVLRIAIEDILAPVAVTAEYQETARQIQAVARKHVAGFPGVGGVSRRQMSDSLSGPEIAGITGLLFMYNRFIADITIAMIRVKQAFAGASSATENKFPIT